MKHTCVPIYVLLTIFSWSSQPLWASVGIDNILPHKICDVGSNGLEYGRELCKINQDLVIVMVIVSSRCEIEAWLHSPDTLKGSWLHKDMKLSSKLRNISCFLFQPDCGFLFLISSFFPFS